MAVLGVLCVHICVLLHTVFSSSGGQVCSQLKDDTLGTTSTHQYVDPSRERLGVQTQGFTNGQVIEMDDVTEWSRIVSDHRVDIPPRSKQVSLDIISKIEVSSV